MMTVIYLIGSLRNPEVPQIANKFRTSTGWEIFDDWYSPGPEADDYWRDYEKGRGRNYREALKGWAGKHVFEFDLNHLNRSDGGVLVLPAGKSCHLEAGYLIGMDKPVWGLYAEEPERYDVMMQFCQDIYYNIDELIEGMKHVFEVGSTIPEPSSRDQQVVERPLDKGGSCDSETQQDNSIGGVQRVPPWDERSWITVPKQGTKIHPDDPW